MCRPRFTRRISESSAPAWFPWRPWESVAATSFVPWFLGYGCWKLKIVPLPHTLLRRTRCLRSPIRSVSRMCCFPVIKHISWISHWLIESRRSCRETNVLEASRHEALFRQVSVKFNHLVLITCNVSRTTLKCAFKCDYSQHVNGSAKASSSLVFSHFTPENILNVNNHSIIHIFCYSCSVI